MIVNTAFCKTDNLNANLNATKSLNTTKSQTLLNANSTLNSTQSNSYSENNPVNAYPTISGYINHRQENTNFLESNFPSNSITEDLKNKKLEIKMNNNCVICM